MAESIRRFKAPRTSKQTAQEVLNKTLHLRQIAKERKQVNELASTLNTCNVDSVFNPYPANMENMVSS